MKDKNSDQEFDLKDAFNQASKALASGEDAFEFGGEVADNAEDAEDVKRHQSEASDDFDNEEADVDEEEVGYDYDDSENDEDESSETVDYRTLYENALQQQNEAHRRIADIEARFNSLRARADQESQEEGDTQRHESEDKAQEAANETSEALSELYELYPELASELPRIIDSRVAAASDKIQQQVNSMLESNVKPIADKVYASEAKAHEDTILSAHPDIKDHISSGSFRKWVNTLPSYQQAGARQVCETGSAQEVIDLFDSYKAANGISGTSKNSGKQKKKTAPSSTVDRMRDALYVKSGQSETPALGDNNKNNKEEDPSEMFKKFTKEIMEEESF